LMHAVESKHASIEIVGLLLDHGAISTKPASSTEPSIPSPRSASPRAIPKRFVY
jgi:hypothetical protein